MTKMSSWSCHTITAKVRMPKINKATINVAGDVGGRAVIMGVLSAKTPATSLPKGALLD